MPYTKIIFSPDVHPKHIHTLYKQNAEFMMLNTVMQKAVSEL